MLERLKYGNTIIEYSLSYEKRKTLGIKVYPDKTVHVIAPFDSSLVKIEEKLRKKASWIKKQLDFFISFYPFTPPRKFVSGETHLYLGRQYRLKLVESLHEKVVLSGGHIIIFSKDIQDKQRIELKLKAWYKQKASAHFEQLFEKNKVLAKPFNNSNPALQYRWMMMRWGSCDKNGTIHLNLELIKAPKKCIEYVIIHELCHLEHLNHSNQFYNLLDKLYPNWKETKDSLEKLMV